MTPIEVFAFIVALVAAIKIIIVLAKPKVWMNVVKKIYANSALLAIISLILAAIVLYYLLMEVTIVQIFAVMLFLMLLMAVGMAIYKKEVMGIVPKLLKRRIIRRSLLYILIWIALIIWVLYAIFV